MNRAKLIAQETMHIVEAIIKCDAGEGKCESKFNLYAYHNFNSKTERTAYRDTITEILKTNGYIVKYNTIDDYLSIRFF